jgi:hypothetical protein
MFDEIEALFALNDRFHRWRRSKSGSTDESVASRFIRLLESHGVYPNQIPRFFDHGLRLADVKDASVLLPRLEEPMLEDACRLFPIPLPITFPDTALSLQCEHEIGDALEADPERFRAGKAIVLAVEEAAEGGDHAHHGVE